MKQFISNLNLSRKFALIGVLALAMVALPAWLVIKNAFEELSVAHAEAAGIAPAGDMLTLIKLTQQHRGQSAMVPIVSADLDYRKDLLYNGAKLPAHPVATLRLKNGSGLTLERGPVTVLEKGEYVGEAVLPFTVVGSEMAVAYAVELGVKVREEGGAGREIRGLRIRGFARGGNGIVCTGCDALVAPHWKVDRSRNRALNDSNL